MSTSQLTFNGKPCKRCNNTLRYVAKKNISAQCVHCKTKLRRKCAKESEQKSAALHGCSQKLKQQMAEDQNYLCLICKKKKKLCVDHCHATGKIRGLLCISCNLGLGLFKDNTEFLEQAVKYIRNSG